ncbi:DUF1707 SHOCT-like domain-containing protein [Nakamurella sp. GG22]
MTGLGMTGADLPGSGMTPPRMRAGTTDRQKAVDRLTQHFTDGRLEPDEFDERMGKAYKATYLDEFPALFVDLPEDERAFAPVGGNLERYGRWSPPQGSQDRSARPWGPPRGGPPRGLIAVAVVVGLFWIGVLTHALFLFPLIWLAFALSVGGHRRRHWQRYNSGQWSGYGQRSGYGQGPGRRPGPWDRPEHWQHR